jgi:YhcH/YjgK/YiaL family protein
MIIESREKITELLPYLPLRLARALAYLRDTDPSLLPDGEYPIEGRDIFLKINSYQTGSKEELTAEAHYKYIDVQYMIKGREVIWRAPFDKLRHTVTADNPKEDYVFFSRVKGEKQYIFSEGEVIIFFPWDVHRTKGKVGGRPAAARKAVLKVRTEG